jgi:hypothetical protein
VNFNSECHNHKRRRDCGNGDSDVSISRDTFIPDQTRAIFWRYRDTGAFWEQFKQSIDDDPSLTTINKHIFPLGYLEEPKHLVQGIAVVAETYEDMKKNLDARYLDKKRIIQAHLDYRGCEAN